MGLPFKVLAFDHVHLYVGNAKQAAYYYQKLYGFEPFAYSGLETGQKEYASYALRQKRAIFVVSAPLWADSPMNEFLTRHGDAVRDIAFLVDDVEAAWHYTTSQGAKSVREPEISSDDNGSVKIAAIETYGDTIHTFIDRKEYKGLFLPGYEAYESPIATKPTGLIHIDHIVGNQPDDQMEPMVEYYQKVFGFHRFWTVDDQDVATEHSSLRSVVVANDNEIIKMPINEPADGIKKSQIKEYVEFNSGAGVQHIAMTTQDIVKTVTQLVENGVEFLQVPDTYYDELTARVGEIDEEIKDLRPLGVLVDRDDKGYLLQLFTKPVEDRPTLFLEIIQRKGSNGFGKGNFKALFESIEREQEKRGTL